jgi:hypothetical protein
MVFVIVIQQTTAGVPGRRRRGADRRGVVDHRLWERRQEGPRGGGACGVLAGAGGVVVGASVAERGGEAAGGKAIVGLMVAVVISKQAAIACAWVKQGSAHMSVRMWGVRLAG